MQTKSQILSQKIQLVSSLEVGQCKLNTLHVLTVSTHQNEKVDAGDHGTSLSEAP